MIYQITYDLNVSKQRVFSLLKEFENFIYYNNTIYINTKKSKKDILLAIKNVINEDEQVFIKQIDVDNCCLPFQVQQWIDRIKYRQKIKEMQKNYEYGILSFLEDFEKELEKQVIERSGVSATQKTD